MDSKNRTYKTMKTLLLKQKDVEKLITMSETIESVRVWSPTEEKMRKYKREIEDLLNIDPIK